LLAWLIQTARGFTEEEPVLIEATANTLVLVSDQANAL
jgi:hypothetical protein